jgi:hypothetical protein
MTISLRAWLDGGGNRDVKIFLDMEEGGGGGGGGEEEEEEERRSLERSLMKCECGEASVNCSCAVSGSGLAEACLTNWCCF